MNNVYQREAGLAVEYHDTVSRPLEEFKSAQNSGGTSVILYTSQTTNTWDVLNANINTAYDYAEWIVVFVPDISSINYTEFGLNYNFHSGATGLEQVYTYLDPLIAGANGTQRYIVRTQNVYMPLQLDMKFQIRSSSPGELFFSRTL